MVWHIEEGFLDFVEDKTEWTGTDIRFDIIQKDGETEVRFTHIGLVPDVQCFDGCSSAWTFYINGSLRRLITTGKGEPNDRESVVASTRAAQPSSPEGASLLLLVLRLPPSRDGANGPGCTLG